MTIIMFLRTIPITRLVGVEDVNKVEYVLNKT